MSDLAPYACVEHGVTGFKARTADEFGHYLRRLVEDEDLRTRMGAAARAEALRAHTPASQGPAIRARFEEVLRRTSPQVRGLHGGLDA